MYMKKVVILFIQMLPWLYCSAQKNSVDHVYLTNYTIGKESSIVGEVRVQSGEIKSVNVSGENSTAFKINKNNQLIVQPKKLKQGQQWFDVTLNVQTSKGNSISKFK